MDVSAKLLQPVLWRRKTTTGTLPHNRKAMKIQVQHSREQNLQDITTTAAAAEMITMMMMAMVMIMATATVTMMAMITTMMMVKTVKSHQASLLSPTSMPPNHPSQRVQKSQRFATDHTT